ncbi:MAG: DUF72 domain-containing protein [Atopostipes suicloacalis]|nr:DUF72 domain-containing protein [Atopostipes suicloacalis]
MIEIALTNWSDHPLIASDKKRLLEDYASHFPVVEMDTSYYAIPSEKNINNWINKTPESFQFIPKAHQKMTLHQSLENPAQSLKEIFILFRERFGPMISSGKVKVFLFQFPPFFRYSKENLNYLKQVREWMGALPVAIEFRHQSWYSDQNIENTLHFLHENSFIQVVVDQAQTPSNSVPTVLKGNNKKLSLYRLHGRNYSGWLNAKHERNWRKYRTLYDYKKEEVKTIKENILILNKQSKDVSVIFNNNSGGHAAKNAKELQKMLDLNFNGLHPQQLKLL